MKNYFKIEFVFSFLLIFSLLVIGGCSSDDNTIDDNEIPSGDSTFIMKFDGETWISAQTTLMTTAKQGYAEDGYEIIIHASRLNSEGDRLADNLHITIDIDSSKFLNPNGTYPFIHGSETNYARMVYNFDSDGSNVYDSQNPQGQTESTGEIKITDYKIGEQALGKGEGFLRLSGTFNLDIYSVNSGEKIEIREGTFNVDHNILF